MNSIPVKFRYLNAPGSCWDEKEPKPCAACGEERPGYWFLHIQDDGYEEYHVCQPCLVSGKLIACDIRVNEGDIDLLREQLREIRPELSEDEREALAVERTQELEWRTPHPKVYNGFTWQIHCGDYCVFFHKVDADDLNRLAPDGDGKAFLAAHFPSDYSEGAHYLDEIWEEKLQGFMRFYLWQCSHCGKYLLTSDSD